MARPSKKRKINEELSLRKIGDNMEGKYSFRVKSEPETEKQKNQEEKKSEKE